MNEPKVIFLQIRRDMGDEEDSFLDCEDITWCIDSQFETDIEYCKITAAELAAIRARVGELERERDELRDALKKMTAHFGLDEDEMKEQEYFLNKKAVIAIRAANAALAKGAK